MQTNITEVQPAEFEMEITASAEDLAPKLKEALRAQRTQTSMKGFRPGKVPMSLVKKMYGRAIAYEIAERSIQETYEKEVLQSESYDVMGQPRLVALDYEDIDGEMQARIRFGVRPEFELKALSDETVTKLVHEVTSEDIDQEIDRMVKDAESHADEDKQRREEVEARNRLDGMTYEVEKNMKEWEDKLDESAKSTLTETLERSRKALKEGDTAEIQSSLEALQQAYSAAGAAIYQAQQAEAGSDAGFSGGATAGAGFEDDATAQATGAAADEDVVEADYEIVEEDGK